MTDKQFWMKMDQLSASKKLSSSMKSYQLSSLLAEAYYSDLNIIIGCMEEADGELHQTYIGINENTNAKGSRFLLIYSSPRYAKYDPMGYVSAKVFDVMNNMFHKQSIGGLCLNRFSDDPERTMVTALKEVLETFVPGEKPFPPNYSEN